MLNFPPDPCPKRTDPKTTPPPSPQVGGTPLTLVPNLKNLSFSTRSKINFGGVRTQSSVLSRHQLWLVISIRLEILGMGLLLNSLYLLSLIIKVVQEMTKSEKQRSFSYRVVYCRNNRYYTMTGVLIYHHMKWNTAHFSCSKQCI